MDKKRHLLEAEIQQLKSRIGAEPEAVLELAKQYVEHSIRIRFAEGSIVSLMIMSRCYWCLMDYRNGLKCIKKANSELNSLDTDDYRTEILHLHALQYWGQAKYYSAQKFWVSALEHSSLTGDAEIQIECLIGLGNVWRITQDYHLAKSTHELAVTVANNMRFESLEGKARILLSWDLYLLNNFIEMLSVLDGAEEVLSNAPDTTWQAEVWDFRSLALLALNRSDDAKLAAVNAHELAKKHNLVWIMARSFVNLAKIALLEHNIDTAAELLSCAEASAKQFKDNELLSQIYFHQSQVAQQQSDLSRALKAFKTYRRYSVAMVKKQTSVANLDTARESKNKCAQKARQLIHRIREQHEYHPENRLNQMVSETFWWEQLVLFKTELRHSKHSIILIRHPDPSYLSICAEIAHCLCGPQDLLSLLGKERIGILLSEKEQEAQSIFKILSKMIELYPWARKGLRGKLPNLSLQNILTFPFTLEQLEELPFDATTNGYPA
ncbi:hypothetical protein M9194_01990 [Vibrio sp. S4M6]|uniref:hypothetical protein n=1 Tax=Vibrio sinus TaxID=2946865 RepID=UPI00202A9B65|nr:hypothetical protein [Vibrio sinus]